MASGAGHASAWDITPRYVAWTGATSLAPVPITTGTTSLRREEEDGFTVEDIMPSQSGNS
ncbi:hypothetical protein ACFQX4_26280 [Roseomonas sp. GCM10028921]